MNQIRSIWCFHLCTAIGGVIDATARPRMGNINVLTPRLTMISSVVEQV